MSSKERKGKSFIKTPIYPGGNRAFAKFIKDNLQYPKTALSNQVEGTVHLKYQIDHKGKVINAKVVSGIGYGCDEEAMRVIQLLEFKIPDIPRKMKITFNKTSKVKFHLPQKPTNHVNAINYNLVTKTKSETPKQSTTYTYIIKC